MWVQLHARVVEVRPLSRSIFSPQPNVDSSLVTLERLVRNDLVASDPQAVRRVIDGAFSQRRKRLANALSAALGISKSAVEDVLAGLSIDQASRAETVEPEAFVLLTAGLAGAVAVE